MPVGIAILGKHIRQSSDKSKETWKRYKSYYFEYKKKHRKKYIEYYRKYNSIRKNKLRRIKQRLAIKIDCPWYGHFMAAKRRCEIRKSYIKKGIKFNLSIIDIQALWIRDKAWKMKLPVLHRKDNNGDYELSNCEFIPCGKHTTLHLSKNKCEHSKQ